MGINRRGGYSFGVVQEQEKRKRIKEKTESKSLSIKGIEKRRRYRGEDQQSDYQRILCNSSRSKWITFNGLNYEEWSEQIRFSLGVMSLDQAILTDEEPAAITNESSKLEKSRYETWERSNRLCLNLLRMSMAESIKPSMPKTEKAREFILKIKEQSQSDVADKSIVGSLMSELTTKRMKARIVGIGMYRLIFDTGCFIDLENCLFVPECARNLVSVSRLDDLGFDFKIGHGVFSLYRKDYFYGNGTLVDSLYRVVNIKEIRVEDSSPIVPTQVVIPVVSVQPNTEIEKQNVEHTVPLNQEIENEPIAIQEQNIVPQVPLRRSIRERRSAITDDYVVYDVERHKPSFPYLDTHSMGINRRGGYSFEVVQEQEKRKRIKEKTESKSLSIKGIEKRRRYRGEDQQSDYQRILCNSSRSKWITVIMDKLTKFSLLLPTKISDYV
ncbi:hypothetical protein SADUNF_Sadunf19G0062300 [Salix dunnii]|uniref:Uncharacterized protein n=1 Tax=Salix dunnii TaxID=1413687 RepID=A0A835J5S4_9ROSI|nr:hypothetical protein SADUNF_Sadunf19G0062300 [Salix dunnii]